VLRSENLTVWYDRLLAAASACFKLLFVGCLILLFGIRQSEIAIVGSVIVAVSVTVLALIGLAAIACYAIDRFGRRF
jgi:hypothetical protein